jgi:hypothetical protein
MTAFVLIMVAAMPLATAFVLYRVAPVAAAVFAAVWLGWIVAASFLAREGFFEQDAHAANPWIPVAVLVPMALALLAARTPALSRGLAGPMGAARLAVPQTFRVVGAAFLIAMSLGDLSPVFALPAGLGDVAVGVAAPFVARRLARGEGRKGAIWFNALGILDLVVAVGLGVLTSLGPGQVIHTAPSSLAVSQWPLVLIPTTAVPLALALHLISLRRLRSNRSGTLAS